MPTTEAWVLHKGPSVTVAVELQKEYFTFPEIGEEEVLAEPIYGCWEANMTHALQRSPIDVCRYRGEPTVVLGNAGVVRVLRTGLSVRSLKAGDLCILVSIGEADDAGYPRTILGYDAQNTMGVLAKQIKLHEKQLFPIHSNTKYSYPQWAAFSIRYATAWDNWKIAYGCWRLQMSEDDCPVPSVWGWGGGVTLAELSLAKRFGCRAALISGNDSRLRLIEQMGLTAIDRRAFADLQFDEEQFHSDLAYRRRYTLAELAFLALVHQHTEDKGVSIFVDNIGKPVFRATIKALARQGVITTTGWKEGMSLSILRGAECINRHIHVHTHGSRNSQAAMYFAEETGWMPPIDDTIYSWDDIPQLAQEYESGKIDSYFPIFQVNPL